MFWGWVLRSTVRAVIYWRGANLLEIAVLYAVVLYALSQVPPELLRSDLADTAIVVAISPVMLMWKIINIPLEGYIWWLLPAPILTAAIVAVFFVRSGHRPIAPAAAFVAAVGTAVVAAEPLSKLTMCSAAKELDVTAITRSSIYNSFKWLGDTGRATSHAGLRRNGQILYWSYREMTFLPMPDARNPRQGNFHQC